MNKTIREWCETIHTWAKSKGWWDDFKGATIQQIVADKGINIHAEVSELWESSRNGLFDHPCDKAKRMEELGIKPLSYAEEELADIVIRVFDLSKRLGIDLQTAIESKHAYNENRPYKHGKVH